MPRGGWIAGLWLLGSPDAPAQAAPAPVVAAQPVSAQPAPVIEPASAPPGVSFLAVGDVMLSRHVAQSISDHKDVNFPFARVHDFLRAPDLLFGNLEGPITPGRAVKSGQMVFRADPGVEAGLKEAGFAVLSLANNHIPDHGAKGIADTLSALRPTGITAVGAGLDAEEAARAVILQRQGLRVAFVACNDASVVPARYAAGAGHPGTNLCDVAAVKEAVSEIRPQADVVILSMHHGWEYRQTNPYQVKIAHAAIDAGADLVIGHHPHVVQSVEKYKGKYIAYSLGNFVFDQTFSPAVQHGLAVRAQLTKDGVASIQFVPIVIADSGQPRLASRAGDKAMVFARLEIPLTSDGAPAPLPETKARSRRGRRGM